MPTSQPRISRSITYDAAALKARQAAIAASPALFKTATDRQITRVRPLILKDMKLKPRHSTSFTFVWSWNRRSNLNALRWYFANKVAKGSAGGTYQRSGETERNTKVIGSATTTGGEISIEAPLKAGKFAFNFDFRQIPSHARSGHPRIQDVLAKWTPILNERLSITWQTVADPASATRTRGG